MRAANKQPTGTYPHHHPHSQSEPDTAIKVTVAAIDFAGKQMAYNNDFDLSNTSTKQLPTRSIDALDNLRDDRQQGDRPTADTDNAVANCRSNQGC